MTRKGGETAGGTGIGLPEGQRVYAVGDIHGRDDLLANLLALIEGDRKRKPDAAVTLVFLGDYVDRGPSSRQVVERLMSLPADWNAVCLMGNHESMLLSFLTGDDPDGAWLRNGGDAALVSYGVDPDAVMYAWAGSQGATLEVLDEFRTLFPLDHLRFLTGLPFSHGIGGYFFVHAGVRPGVPLTMQAARDLLWIREPFLDASDNFGAVVVHGHTPARLPQDRPNRIGIDTQAFKTGTLTAVGLEGSNRWFLAT